MSNILVIRLGLLVAAIATRTGWISKKCQVNHWEFNFRWKSFNPFANLIAFIMENIFSFKIIWRKEVFFFFQFFWQLGITWHDCLLGMIFCTYFIMWDIPCLTKFQFIACDKYKILTSKSINKLLHMHKLLYKIINNI